MNEPHTPEPLPPDDLDWESFVPLIGQANRKLARYDGLLHGLANPDLLMSLLSPMTDQEAVLSSRIEGTQASFEDVLQYEADPGGDVQPKKKEDITEIINYRNAMEHAVEEMKDFRLHLDLLKEIHAILLDSARGEGMARGQFRDDQVWIGAPSSSMEEAKYVPPEGSDVGPLMEELEQYIHEVERDLLVQLALIHAQFEMIHPFMDGNGRVGRILIPLFLYEKDVLSQPMFYISEYIESHRREYFDRLLFISRDGDWNGWVEFFLEAIIEQADANTKKARNLVNLYDEMRSELPDKTGSKYALQALDAIFQKPIFSSTEFQEVSGIPKRAANRMIKKLLEEDVISKVRETKGRKPGIYHFDQLLDIVNM